MKQKRTLQELFSKPGFRAQSRLLGRFGEAKASIIVLRRRKKRASALDVERVTSVTTTRKWRRREIWTQAIVEYIFNLNAVEYAASGVACE